MWAAARYGYAVATRHPVYGEMSYVELDVSARALSATTPLDVIEECTTLGPGDVIYVYLPLAHLPSVPRLFEKVYRTVLAHAGDDQRVAAAVEAGLRVRAAPAVGDPVSDVDAAAFARAEERLFSLVRTAADGEVLARGANVFAGYHNNAAGTAEMQITAWATSRGLPPDPAALAGNPDVLALIQSEVETGELTRR